MFIDARTIPDGATLETDICIIGGGAAGITLAREFSGDSFRVSVLESGDMTLDSDTQLLYAGENVGLPYFPLQAPRLRYFGGTTNHWGGMCQPFTEFDFEAHDWIPYSGWPIRKSDIDPYYDDAATICQLNTSEWDLSYWESNGRLSALPLSKDRVITRISQNSSSAVRRFGEVYHDDIKNAENVTTYLNANVVEIETDEMVNTVTTVRVACLTGNRFSVAARQFILAVGGIENARLLLLSNSRQPAGLGNQNDLVGRFFLEHPRFTAGVWIPSNRHVPIGFYELHRVDTSIVKKYLSRSEDSRRIKGYLSLSSHMQREEELVDVQVRLQPVYDEAFVSAIESEDIHSLRQVVKALRRRERSNNFGKHVSNVITDLETWKDAIIPTVPIASPNPTVVAHALASVSAGAETLIPELFGDIGTFVYGEIFRGVPVESITLSTRITPVPNPDSRIMLSSERDQLGQNRLQLDWRLGSLDKYSVQRTLEILGAELGRAGLGRVQVDIDESDAGWPDDLAGGSHHMGTTRMSDDPKQGVVDANCKVHGISNLFIAGSSVFPTAGSGTPTLTLVALALRLADHIKEKMR